MGVGVAERRLGSGLRSGHDLTRPSHFPVCVCSYNLMGKEKGRKRVIE